MSQFMLFDTIQDPAMLTGRKVLSKFSKIEQGKFHNDFSRILLSLDCWQSPRCHLVWKLKRSGGRVFFHLAVKKGDKFLLTPSTVDIVPDEERREKRAEYRAKSGRQWTPGSLTEQVFHEGLMPTVREAAARGNCNNDRGRGNLEDYIASVFHKGLLPTPETSQGGPQKDVKISEDGSYYRINSKGVRYGVRMQDIVASGLLPTPDCSDRRSDNSSQWGLSNYANNNMLPTPTTTDSQDQRPLRQMTIDSMEKGNKKGANLHHIVTNEKLSEMYGMLPTPTADDNPAKNTGKRNQDGLQKRAYLETGKTAQLNPMFVAEMMGFPVEWTINPFIKK